MTDSTNPETLLTVAEVAKDRWRVALKRVYSVVESGELPSIRLGPKSIRIRLKDLEAYEAAHRIRIPQPPMADPKTLADIAEAVSHWPSLSERQRDVVRSAVASLT